MLNQNAKSTQVPTRGHLGPSFERSLNPMFLVDAQRRYIDANPAASLLSRMPREEIVGHKVDDFTPPADRADIERNWAEFLRRDGVSSLTEFHFPDGTRVPVQAGTAPVAPGVHLIVCLPWATHEEADSTLVEEADMAEREGQGLTLTNREREVLTLLALGDTGEQIARELFISPETVRTHVQHARQKLGATTRGHAIALALVAGEIAPDLAAGRHTRHG